MLLKSIVLVLACATVALASPFELLENYIENFQKQLDHLRSYLNSDIIEQRKHEDHSYEVDEDNVKDTGEYDFIVIGGGTSGSVIASRLSEVPEWKILLVEAGDVESAGTKVPSMHSCLESAGSPLTWGYYSTPQNYSCLGNEERKCYIPTAKILGGTTAVNDMLYVRGNARDFDLWADNGLKGWCSISLAPYFKKIEDAQLHTIMDHSSHRFGGPVHLENPQYPSEIAHKFLEAAHETGLKEIDLNGKQSIGFGYPQLMTSHGQRYSASEAYLQKAQHRSNLVIKTQSQTTKILIGEHTKEARGIQYLHDGHLCTATAKKEVILAAGPINSAKLLLLSGIGPHEELKHLQIHPVADLKVAQNLIHHPTFSLNYVIKDQHPVELPFYYSKEIDYLRNGKGPLANTGVDLVGFIKTENSKGRNQYPDVEVVVKSHTEDNVPHHPKLQKIEIDLILLHPKSRGQLTLANINPLSHPHINLNDLSDHENEDLETLLSAVKYIQKLVHTHPLENLTLIHDNPHCTDYEKDDYWRCAIKHSTSSRGEITSTAPMGQEEEGHFGDSVVDLNLCVHGIEKLRVADDSVVPVSISGQLAATKIVIGEKCADLLKEEWTK